MWHRATVRHTCPETRSRLPPMVQMMRRPQESPCPLKAAARAAPSQPPLQSCWLDYMTGDGVLGLDTWDSVSSHCSCLTCQVPETEPPLATAARAIQMAWWTVFHKICPRWALQACIDRSNMSRAVTSGTCSGYMCIWLIPSAGELPVATRMPDVQFLHRCLHGRSSIESGHENRSGFGLSA